MIKNSFLIFCIFIPGLALAQNFNPKKVIPAKLAKYDFGMTLDAFKEKNKNAVQASTDPTDFRIVLTDVNAGSDYRSVTYYFDMENNKPLYEMIIEYKDEKTMNDYCTLKLKAPNNDKEWKWITKEGYVFKAWTFGKKLVFALALPSTEWSN